MIRVATWNLNGIRACLRKGFEAHIKRIKPQVLLLQEIRARPEQVPEPWADPPRWNAAWHPAEKPGYAGTALWSRSGHKAVGTGLAELDKDEEGRILDVTLDNGLRVVSVYLPSGSSGDHRQVEKEKWMERFMPWAMKLAKSKTPTLLGGDFNIAHTERDIFYAKSNQNQSGFLPHEREWMGDLIGIGWRDLIREQAGDRDGPYSWWSNRGQARALDRGWRIDYLLANSAAHKLVRKSGIDRKSGLDASDHAIVWADLDL